MYINYHQQHANEIPIREIEQDGLKCLAGKTIFINKNEI
jgi:hypothetical protein